MLDTKPEQSPTTESKAATTPSVDLFGSGTGVDIHFSLSVWNLLISSGYHTSTPLSTVLFSPHTSWFVPHSALRPVHVNPRVESWSVLVAACYLCCFFLPALLILFFAPQPPRFLLSCILPLACVGKLDLPAVSRGPSPLPEPAPAGDIVTGE